MAKPITWLGLSLVGLSLQSRAEPTVTPYRPTVSNPAALSEPGWLEMEAGLDKTRQRDALHTESLPFLLKYAFTPDFGILLGGVATAQQTDAEGNTISGRGDTNLTLKQRWGWTDNVALGLEYGFKSPTAKQGLGSGKTDYTVNGIASAELPNGDAVDINLGATYLGGVEPEENRTQVGWAAAIAHGLTDKLAVAFEFSGTRRTGVPSTSQFLTAATYSISNYIVVDAGIAWGLNSASQDRSLFLGTAILLGKVPR